MHLVGRDFFEKRKALLKEEKETTVRTEAKIGANNNTKVQVETEFPINGISPPQ